MSIQTAIKQIADALAEANTKADESRKGVIYWDEQVVKLTKSYASIKELFPEDAVSYSPDKKTKAQGKEKSLPKTPTEFWIGLLTEEPQKMAGILSAAAEKLGVKMEDDENIKVLRARQSNVLQKLIEDGKIKSEGSRQDRTYFLVA